MRISNKIRKKIKREEIFQNFKRKIILEQVEHFTKQGLVVTEEFMQRFERNALKLHEDMQKNRKELQDSYKQHRRMLSKANSLKKNNL